MCQKHSPAGQIQCFATDRHPPLPRHRPGRPCRIAFLIRRLARHAVQAELRRLAAEEAAQWATCFGPGSPSSLGAKVERVMRIASARAVAAEMRAEASYDLAER